MVSGAVALPATQSLPDPWSLRRDATLALQTLAAAHDRVRHHAERLVEALDDAGGWREPAPSLSVNPRGVVAVASEPGREDAGRWTSRSASVGLPRSRFAIPLISVGPGIRGAAVLGGNAAADHLGGDGAGGHPPGGHLRTARGTPGGLPLGSF